MQTNSGTNLKRAWLVMLLLLTLVISPGASATAWGEELTPARNSEIAGRPSTTAPAWVELAPIAENEIVRIWVADQRKDAGNACFVITHGMEGTESGDRFHELAETICKKFPQATVLLVDWSELASAKFGGIPNPWKVAGSIDEVGDQAALVLKNAGLDPARTILIGESFGNWVNARIARQLGGVQGILAMNPANEAGGYTPPDLRKDAKHSWSFQTYSIYDTTLEIAESDFWLEAPAGATNLVQHVWGICWLSARFEADDTSWLSMEMQLPERREGHFRASVTRDGQLLKVQPPRRRPVPSEVPAIPAGLAATDVAVASP